MFAGEKRAPCSCCSTGQCLLDASALASGLARAAVCLARPFLNIRSVMHNTVQEAWVDWALSPSEVEAATWPTRFSQQFCHCSLFPCSRPCRGCRRFAGQGTSSAASSVRRGGHSKLWHPCYELAGAKSAAEACTVCSEDQPHQAWWLNRQRALKGSEAKCGQIRCHAVGMQLSVLVC